MSIVTTEAALLFAAGLVAGVVGSAGGTASLISYPALLAVGIPALPANVTNAVAFVACWPGSGLASRPELRGRGPWLLRWGAVAAVGGAVGAVLLLFTPEDVFGRLVPFLVAFASLALLVQPRVSAWQGTRLGKSGGLWLPCGLFAVSVYDGYWGAGAGVMILVVLLLTVDQHMARANALKNMMLGAADIVAALAFILFGPVDWKAAVPLALGLLVGSGIGPSVARRVPANILRIVVGLAGLGLAVHLWSSPS